MRIVDINHIKPGMILARPVFHPIDGKLLLHQNVKLQEQYIKRLKELQYTHLYIQDLDDTDADLDILEPVKQETKIKAIRVLRETLEAYEKNQETGLGQLREVVAEMIDQIYENKEVVYNMIDIRSYDNYTYAHSVNVCTLALIMGCWMNLTRQDLEILGIGALLHDVGKIYINLEILNKPEPLLPEEYELVKTHTVKGYELLKEKMSISYISAHIAYQHHERVDGSGYPRGLSHEKIHRFAKIVAVADVYDAMTSQRVYREALPSDQVLKELKSGADLKYDRISVESLERVVAPYLVGSVLTLSNGEEVLVTNVTRFECLVKVLTGQRSGTVFNLYSHKELSVLKTVS